MPTADTARLVAELTLKDNLSKQVGTAITGIDRLDKKVSGLGVKSIALGSALGVGIDRLVSKGVGALFGNIQAGEESLHALQDLQGQTEAVIKSTGGAAGVSAGQVRDYANALEDLTTADDKSIQNAENLLLTFTQIGKDVFPDATKAVVNMGIAFAHGDASQADFQASAIQVGKALNDPIKGITALRKVGVSFTQQQQDQIKALVKAGKTEEAQKVILRELATEFGNAGEAAGKSGAAGTRRFNDAVEDLQISLAQGLDPALTEIRDELGKTLKDPAVQQSVRDLGKFLGEAAKQGLAFAKEIPWGTVADALKKAAGFAGDLIKVFTSLPPEAQATIIALAGLNKLTGGAVTSVVSELGKGLIKGVLGMTAGIVNINAGVVKGPGGLPTGTPGATPGGGGITGIVKDGLEAGFKLAIPAVVGGVSAALIVRGALGPNNPDIQRIDQGETPLANRDPRRFNQNGQVVANFPADVKGDLKTTAQNTSKLVGKGVLDQQDKSKLESIAQNTQRQNDKADALNAAANKATAQDSINAAIAQSAAQTATANAARQYAATQESKGAIQAASAASSIAQAQTTQAARDSAAAIRAKKLSVEVNNYNRVQTNISIRDTIGAQILAKSYYKVAS